MAVSMAILSGFACAPVAQAQYQWTAIPLHPDGASYSVTNAAVGDLQAGTIDPGIGYAGRAALWSGSSESWTNLTPDWATGAFINGMDGTTQAGQILTLQGQREFYRAALWQSTAESAVILHPAEGYTASDAKAIAGNMQVGIAGHYQTGQTRAVLWNGTAESFVDLNPAGSNQSRALATDGTLQGGWAALPGGGDREAVIWSGTPESVVNLAPDGALRSQVNAMAPDVQVGRYSFQGENPRAAMWSGSAESLIDMNPQGAIGSEFFGTSGLIHTGSAIFSSFGNAGIWFGDDPDSFVNLHDYLPPEYFVSGALDVSMVGDTIYVVGTATRGPTEAWLWVGTIPSPGTLPVMVGGLLLLNKSRRRR